MPFVRPMHAEGEFTEQAVTALAAATDLDQAQLRELLNRTQRLGAHPRT